MRTSSIHRKYLARASANEVKKHMDASLPEPPQRAEWPAVESVDTDDQQDTNCMRAEKITGVLNEIGVDAAHASPYGASTAVSAASS